MADPEFHVERIDRPDGRSELRFSGRMRFREMQPVWSDVRAHVGRCGQTVDLDLSAVPAADGGAIALLLELKNELVERGARVEIVGAQGGVRGMLQLYGEHAARPAHKPPPPRIGILDQIGREALRIFGEARALDFLGDLTTAVGASMRAPRSVRWRDIVRLMERAGADGLPIVLLINFLVGLVTAFQAAIQLQQFGAEVFVADLVALSVTRELGPLMTAVIVAGRSGAAFSAEIGTMKVSEEVDALRTLGLDPYRFLVVPRAITLVLVMPLLTICADFAAILGGMLVAVNSLDVTVGGYLAEVRHALQAWDVTSGLLKSLFFGLAIALVACQRGLATGLGAEGVGRSTTSAVVTSLFFLVVSDALFTMLFRAFGR